MKTRLPPQLSALLHGRLAPAKLSLLSWWNARHISCGLPQAWIRLAPRAADTRFADTVVVIRKRSGRIVAIDANLAWLRGRSGFTTAWRRIGVFVDLLSDPRVPDGDWPADLADHVRDPGPVIGFCSYHPDTILVPDRGFHSSRGYARSQAAASRAPAFADRDATIVWRGSPTGFGELSTATMRADDPALRQRVRMCLLLRDAQADFPNLGVDARLVAGAASSAEAHIAYHAAGIAGDPVPEASWLGRRFAIDIDGNANAFSNLFLRLLFGCCVIKVASPLGFRQWYYDRLEPGRHYVPVAADLSDLVERIAWCRDHPDDCRHIAAAGQELAASMTPSNERRRAIDAIIPARSDHAIRLTPA